MKNKIPVISFFTILAALTIWSWCKPADKISDSELRRLAQFPKLSVKTVLAGDFMKQFESYSLDQFPMRDDFRTLKAVTYLSVFRQMDNNGIYVEDNYAVKMEYPLNEDSVDYAVDRFQNVYEKLLKGTDVNCFLAVVPDKNYYLAKEHGALSFDYGKMYEKLQTGVNFAEYIDLTDLLKKSNYYRTDTHWNQVTLGPVADRLAEAMGVTLDTAYEKKQSKSPFYGVYYGQAALPMKADKMEYLTNAAIEACTVTDLQNNKVIPVYDESKMTTRSPYDFFLGGSLSLITIENPLATTERELVVFRDSFGSSLAPLLISGYRKITIVDIRYLPGDRLGRFIQFDNQDVLFLYSTLVLNNSNVLK